MKTTICPTCGNPKNSRSKQCQRCHLTAIAPKGWEATKALYGEKAAVKHLRQYRLTHPSNLEVVVAQHLDNLGARYEREVWFEAADGAVYLADFQIGQQIIEVNGTWAHQFHIERDERKMAALQAAGYQVLVLSDTEIFSSTLSDTLSNFVS